MAESISKMGRKGFVLYVHKEIEMLRVIIYALVAE